MVPAILPRFMTQFSSSVGVAILTNPPYPFRTGSTTLIPAGDYAK